MSESLLITGAAGFIGSHLARRLVSQGQQVVGLDNFDRFYDRAIKQANVARIGGPGQFEFIEADIRDAATMRRLAMSHQPRAIVHLAALAGVRPSIAEPARYADVNVNGLTAVLEAARAIDCRAVVFASSSSVYGNNKEVPFCETVPADEPISPYAATKRAGELICHTYARLFHMRIAALRFFTVYGPAQRPDLAIAKFMRLIAAGEHVPMYGDGSSSRDYTYIDDIIQGVLAALDIVTGQRVGPSQSGESFFRLYNLGNAQPISLREMIDTIANVVGRPARIQQLPVQPGDVERTWADLTRSTAELNYYPRMSFIEGLQRQWQHHRQALMV